MAKTVWLVSLSRKTDDHDDVVIVLGVYDNFADAVDRVDKEFFEQEIKYVDDYGIECTCENHSNGYAELHLDYGQRDTIIQAVEYEVNKDSYDLI